MTSQEQGYGRKEKALYFSALNGMFPSCFSKGNHIFIRTSALTPYENNKLGLP